MIGRTSWPQRLQLQPEGFRLPSAACPRSEVLTNAISLLDQIERRIGEIPGNIFCSRLSCELGDLQAGGRGCWEVPHWPIKGNTTHHRRRHTYSNLMSFHSLRLSLRTPQCYRVFLLHAHVSLFACGSPRLGEFMFLCTGLRGRERGGAVVDSELQPSTDVALHF